MNNYMIVFDVPKILPDEFLALIPSQRTQIGKLMEEGKLLSYMLAMDRSRVWATVLAESKAEAVQTVKTLPLTRFMEFHVVGLALHEQSRLLVPQFSLN